MAVTVKAKAGKPISLATTTGSGAKPFEGKVEASWDVNKTALDPHDTKKTFDVDISLVMRDLKGEAMALCYYDDLTPFPGVEHSLDNTTGEGDGVDEYILFTLDGNFPYPIVDLFVNIDDAVNKKQNWAMIDNAKIVVNDLTTGNKIEIEPGMDLMAGGEVSMWLARFYLDGNTWKMVEITEKFDPTYVDIQAFADKFLPTAK